MRSKTACSAATSSWSATATRRWRAARSGAGTASAGRRWAGSRSQVTKAGIKKVTGDLLADDTIFDRVRGVPDSNGRTSPYIGPLSGLSYNENRTGGSGFVPDPAKRTAEELDDGLRNRGVQVQGGSTIRETPDELLAAPPLAATRSAPLAELVEETNRPSNNFFAEMLLKRLDAADGDQGTTKGGTEEVEQFARQIGSDVHAVGRIGPDSLQHGISRGGREAARRDARTPRRARIQPLAAQGRQAGHPRSTG